MKMYVCPNCHSRVGETQKICTQCHTKLDKKIDYDSSQTVSGKGVNNNKKYACPQCGNSVGQNDKFCLQCGKSLEDKLIIVNGKVSNIACPKCGVSITMGSKFCNNCGNDFSVNKYIVVKEKVDPNKNSLSSTQTANQTSSSTNTFDEIRKYKELLDAGVITQDEFNDKKKELLGI